MPVGRLTYLLIIAVPLLLTVGCASRKQMMDLQSQTDRIAARIDSLSASQQRIESLVTQLGGEVRNYSAAAQFGSSSLQENVQGLTARLDDILNRMDRSLAPLEEWLRDQGSKDSSGAKILGVDFFDAAQRDLGLGNYDLAEIGFLQFLEQNPQGDLTDDARLGLAESYYHRKQYDEAIEEYQRVIDLDRNGPKVPAAMLKLGLCYRAQQNIAAARKQWEELIERFPHSEEAGVAGQRLSELKGRR